MTEPLTLPEGWAPLRPDQTHAFLAQLWRELGPGHPLIGHKVRAVASRGDDVVYALEGWEAPYAVVHLAWPPIERAPLIWPMRGKKASRFVPEVVPLARLEDLARGLG